MARYCQPAEMVLFAFINEAVELDVTGCEAVTPDHIPPAVELCSRFRLVTLLDWIPRYFKEATPRQQGYSFPRFFAYVLESAQAGRDLAREVVAEVMAERRTKVSS